MTDTGCYLNFLGFENVNFISTLSKKLPGKWKHNKQHQTVPPYEGFASDISCMLYGKYLFFLFYFHHLHHFKDFFICT